MILYYMIQINLRFKFMWKLWSISEAAFTVLKDSEVDKLILMEKK